VVALHEDTSSIDLDPSGPVILVKSYLKCKIHTELVQETPSTLTIMTHCNIGYSYVPSSLSCLIYSLKLSAINNMKSFASSGEFPTKDRKAARSNTAIGRLYGSREERGSSRNIPECLDWSMEETYTERDVKRHMRLVRSACSA
jgi:hypothetical protein